MHVEIERKFLVNPEKWKRVVKPAGKIFRQVYLSTDVRMTVRVRIAGETAWLTIKGKTEGISRPEFEYEIPVGDAEALAQKFSRYEIEKIRYEIQHDGKTWEVDVFTGVNEGLIIAEIELGEEDEHVELPEWISTEVTHDVRYANSNLATHPFKNW